MSQYFLSTYSVEGEAWEQPSPEDMQAFMQHILDLEAEMDATGTFVFGGALHGHETATVVQAKGGEVVTTDGPFAEAKEHIAGFYIINAEDLDAALAWGRKVSEATGRPIEVRPFRATGRMADHMPDMSGA